MYFVVINSFFDTKDFSPNPIKKYLEPYFVMSGYNESHYYNMNIAINQGIANDDYIYESNGKELSSV